MTNSCRLVFVGLPILPCGAYVLSSAVLGCMLWDCSTGFFSRGLECLLILPVFLKPKGLLEQDATARYISLVAAGKALIYSIISIPDCQYSLRLQYFCRVRLQLIVLGSPETEI